MLKRPARLLFASAALLGSACVSKAEEHYFRGFLEIGSAGICSFGPGECSSYFSVENVIQDVCARRPAVLKVAGHSYGAGAAMRFIWGATACGLKVEAGVFLDPQIHPFDIPNGVRWIALYTPAFWGNGEGREKAELVSETHLSMTFSAGIKSKVRAVFGNSNPSKKVRK